MLSRQTAKKLPRRELEYVAVQASEEVARLEQYAKELWAYIHSLEDELDEWEDGFKEELDDAVGNAAALDG